MQCTIIYKNVNKMSKKNTPEGLVPEIVAGSAEMDAVILEDRLARIECGKEKTIQVKVIGVKLPAHRREPGVEIRHQRGRLPGKIDRQEAIYDNFCIWSGTAQEAKNFLVLRNEVKIIHGQIVGTGHDYHRIRCNAPMEDRRQPHEQPLDRLAGNAAIQASAGRKSSLPVPVFYKRISEQEEGLHRAHIRKARPGYIHPGLALNLPPLSGYLGLAT